MKNNHAELKPVPPFSTNYKFLKLLSEDTGGHLLDKCETRPTKSKLEWLL